VLGLPIYSLVIAPWGTATLAAFSGWLAGCPEAVHGALLQAAPHVFFLQVEPECLAFEPGIAYSAAVLAFSTSVLRRIRGLLLGLVFLVLLNALRIAIDFRLGLWSVEAGVMAIGVLDTLTLTALLAFFLIWARPALTPLRLNGTELIFWGAALTVFAVSHYLWRLYGEAFVSCVPPSITRLLLNGLSLGYVSDVSILPSQADYGWVISVPALSQTVDGKVFQPTIPFYNISQFLFPLISFALCQGLLGGTRRWQWRPWLVGLAGCVLWYGLGLIVMTVHICSIAAMHTASPFFPNIEPPAFFLIAPHGLPTLFYGSGWLYEVFFILSYVAGFALWAGPMARNRYAVHAAVG